LEASPDGLLVVNENGAIVWANERALRLFDFTAVQMVDVNIDELFSRRDVASIQLCISRKLLCESRSGMPWMEFVGRGRSGFPFPVRTQIRIHHSSVRRLTTLAVRDARWSQSPEDSMLRYASQLQEAKRVLHRQNEHLALAVHEQTEHLEQARQVAETASRFKSDFIAEVSHELKNPLQGILSFAELGVDRCRDESQAKLRSFFESIERCGVTMLTLIEQLLTLARLEAGVLECQRGLHDLLETVESVAGEFRPRCGQQGVQVRIVNRDGEVIVNADKDKLGQVVRNLLANAIRFSPAGSEILIGIRREGMLATVSVQDEGPGIPAEELNRVFERFFQASNNIAKGKGTGLGLAICKQIVELHGGSVGVENAATGGAIFSFSIPAVSQRVCRTDQEGEVLGRELSYA
jgi:PAS domain S-box-containing protein